jgi:hypothetical protein
LDFSSSAVAPGCQYVELFVIKSLSFFEPCFQLRTVLNLKSWAINMCATLSSSKLRSNPCAKLDIRLLYAESCSLGFSMHRYSESCPAEVLQTGSPEAPTFLAAGHSEHE